MKGVDRMPKTIFHTTEKSNFILNMKTEEYHRFNLRILILFLILMPVFSLPLEFAKVYSVPGMALAITGVFAIVFVFIGFMKKATPKQLFIPAGILGAMVVWSIVSLYNSYDYSVSLFGADGRSEGMLSVLFYGCFFLLGAQLGTDDNRRKLLDAMLWMGLAECFWGLLQALPLGLPSYYKNLEPLLLFNICLPSGLTGSPIFFATLLVMLAFPAALGAMFTEEKKQRVFYLVCAAVFSLFAVRTQCVIGLAGLALCILAAVIYGVVRKGKTLFVVIMMLLTLGVGIGWSWIAPSVNGTMTSMSDDSSHAENGYQFYDGGIIWDDSSYRLAVSGYYVANNSMNPNGHFAISSLTESYGYLWKGAAKIVKSYPLAGSGPDNLVYPQLYQSLNIGSNPNVFDRTYNYYLHLAATMGIPMAVLFVGLMVLTLVKGAKGCKGSGWLRAGMFGSVVLYLVMMVIGSSCITVAPLFWMLAGCAVGWKKDET